MTARIRVTVTAGMYPGERTVTFAPYDEPVSLLVYPGALDGDRLIVEVIERRSRYALVEFPGMSSIVPGADRAVLPVGCLEVG